MKQSALGARSPPGSAAYEGGQAAENKFVKGLVRLDSIIEERGSALVYCEYGTTFSALFVFGYLLGKLRFKWGLSADDRYLVVAKHLLQMRQIIEFDI